MSSRRNVGALVLVSCLVIFDVIAGLPHARKTLEDALENDRGLFSQGSSSSQLSKHKLPDYFSSRFKRSPEHVVTECVFMTTEEGEFYHKASSAEGKACGIYIVAEPTERIEVRFNYFGVPCSNGGLVAFVDGWELNGEVFPSPRDYSLPMETRFKEFCDERKIKQTFISSSNVALIQYRMPYRGSGFTITVRFVRNPLPCNVLLQGAEEVYTLKNYEKRSNCSISTLFPSAVKIEAINVGVVRADVRSGDSETGTIHKVRRKCQKRGLDDYVQIGGSGGLDNSNMIIADSVCGLNSRPGKFEELIACGTTTVRLVSSGAFDNSVTIHLRQLNGEDDMNSFMSVMCPLEEIKK